MKTRYCQTCQSPIPFNPKKGIQNYQKRKFCSHKCACAGYSRRSPRKHPERMKNCEVCGKQIPKESNRNWNQYAEKRFCSRACNAQAQSQKVTVHCEHCNKEIRRPPSHVRSSVYCSRKCRRLAKTVAYTCPICGKEGRKAQSNLFDGQQHIYCSKKCADEGRRIEKPILACDFCGDEFERYPSELSKAEDRGYTFVFCSHRCRAAMIASQFSPPQPYMGEHTSAPRNGHKGLQWRKAVKERDNYTCQDCGVTGVMLAVHHIKPYALYPELRYEVSNGVTLCYPCHEKLHSLQTTSE